MKTTIDIADDLFLRSKKEAQARGITFREFFCTSLVLALQQTGRVPRPPLRPVTFKGKGLSAAFQQTDWSDIRDTIYQGRGS